jgi:hypothetical protein
VAYETATNTLISAIAAIASSSLAATGDFGSSFVHDPELDPANTATWGNNSRRFNFVAGNGATDLRSMSEATQVQFDEVALVVIYGAKKAIRDIDVAIRRDQAVLRETLRNQANWGRPGSGIQNMHVGGIEAFQFSVTPAPDDSGRRLLSIDINLRHTNQTS